MSSGEETWQESASRLRAELVRCRQSVEFERSLGRRAFQAGREVGYRAGRAAWGQVSKAGRAEERGGSEQSSE